MTISASTGAASIVPAKAGKPERYRVNGEEKTLGEAEYMPDLMHEHLTSFLTKHQTDPVFIYYRRSHVHGDLLPTPDGKPDSTDLMADNVAYMDKLVGKLVTGLEALKLRENTLLLFMETTVPARANPAAPPSGAGPSPE